MVAVFSHSFFVLPQSFANFVEYKPLPDNGGVFQVKL